MKVPALQEHEIDKPPILIVDKKGDLGKILSEEFAKDYLVILCSGGVSSETKNIIHIPFRRRFPEVPDNKYSKIFLIDDGDKITHQSAASFIEKARDNQSPFIFITNIRVLSEAVVDEIASSYSQAKVLVLGDLFDDEKTPYPSTVDRFLKQIRKGGGISLEGEGLQINFPVSLKDSLGLIYRASHVNIAQKIILFFTPHPVTDISLSHLFQKIDPNIKTDFVKSKSRRTIAVPRRGEHALLEYPLERKLRELSWDTPILVPEQESQGSYRRGIFFKRFMTVLLFALFLVLLPLLTTSFYSALGLWELKAARVSAEEGRIEEALGKGKKAKTFFDIAEKTSRTFAAEAKLVGKEGYAEDVRGKVASGQELSLSIINLFEGISYIKNINAGKSTDPREDFNKAVYSIKTSISLIQKVKAQGDLPKEYLKELEEMDPIVGLFMNSSDVLPNILGFDREKKYLVIFQNNMELRPGGGFIGSFGILKVRNARVTEFKIQDVYSIDGQLKEHIEPPFPIRRYLPSAHLYLRDSNFDPDFVRSAISVAEMYNLEAKDTVDGVIGIDLSFAKNILEVLGEVKLADYNTVINRDNFYLVTQKEVEKNFFPGSTKKKDFLSSVAKSIELNLSSREEAPILLLSKALGKSLEEKHILFAFSDSDAQEVFTANGYSSSLWDNRKDSLNTINDYIGISEANLGVNKVNYFVSRSLSKRVKVDSAGKVTTTLSIAYKNSTPKGNKLGGTYKNYLRLIVPKGTKLNGLSINNNLMEIEEAVTAPQSFESKTFVPPRGLEVERSASGEKDLIGFLLNIAPGELKTVDVELELPFYLDMTRDEVDYSLKIYKQPGIDSYPFDLTFLLPENFQLAKGKTPYARDIVKDHEISFTLGKK